MGVITTVFDYIINTLGSTLFMALIMLILGLIAKMKPAICRSLSSLRTCHAGCCIASDAKIPIKKTHIHICSQKI